MSDFANNLRRLRKGNGLTLDELANNMNERFGTAYNKSMISKWELDQVDPYMETIKNIARYFDIPLDDLLGIKLEKKEASMMDDFIPIYGVISAGALSFAEQNIVGYTPAPTFIRYKNKDVFYLRVRGDSMNKEFPDGSDVLVDKDAEVNSGDIAVVLIDGLDATVKQVRFETGKIILIPMSTNTEHYATAYDFSQVEVKIVGKVIGVFKRY